MPVSLQLAASPQLARQTKARYCLALFGPRPLSLGPAKVIVTSPVAGPGVTATRYGAHGSASKVRHVPAPPRVLTARTRKKHVETPALHDLVVETGFVVDAATCAVALHGPVGPQPVSAPAAMLHCWIS
jgi:hypothetical protein